MFRVGELSPYDHAATEEWYIAVKSDHKEAAYGYLKPLTLDDLPKSKHLLVRQTAILF